MTSPFLPDDDPAIVCSLADGDAVADRVAEWHDVVRRAVGRDDLDGGVRLTFASEPGLADALADLAEREHECCTFFDFDIATTGEHTFLAVTAPREARPILDALFAQQ